MAYKGPNEYRISEDGKLASIKLTQGQWTTVAAEDLEEVLKYRWHARRASNKRGWYAQTAIRGHYSTKRGYKLVSLHRFLMSLKGVEMSDREVDHIDRNPLNNTFSNLRPCTHEENTRNRGASATKLKGIHFHNSTGCFEARITANKKPFSLGLYKTEVEAARAYDVAAVFLHRGFRSLNFPQDWVSVEATDVDTEHFRKDLDANDSRLTVERYQKLPHKQEAA